MPNAKPINGKLYSRCHKTFVEKVQGGVRKNFKNLAFC